MSRRIEMWLGTGADATECREAGVAWEENVWSFHSLMP